VNPGRRGLATAGVATAFMVTAGCAGCGACLLTCPEHAIRPAQGGLVVLDTCTGCGECAEVCPVDACVEVTG
jgi:Pyruvate/2-oxoacid:ferredoxin oxidoreductase delta subunit